MFVCFKLMKKTIKKWFYFQQTDYFIIEISRYTDYKRLTNSLTIYRQTLKYTSFDLKIIFHMMQLFLLIL